MYDLFYEEPKPVVKKLARVFKVKKYWPKDKVTCTDCGISFVIVPGEYLCPLCGQPGEWECKSERIKTVPA